MSQLTDDNIIIECSECRDHTEQGLQAMLLHILAEHPLYNQHEAEVFSVQWMQEAYNRESERERKAATK